MKIGLNSDLTEDQLKKLREGDTLYSAYYDRGFNKTDVTEYTFEEYIDAPCDEKTGVWARLKDSSDDKTYALDLTKGLYKSKLNAANALLNTLKEMVVATENACSKYSKEGK